MLRRIIVVLYVSAYISGGTVPNIEELLPPTKTPVNDIHQNSIFTNEIDGIAVNNEANVCLTEVCAKESALMRSYIDESIDPCHNFYDFACGKFIRDTVLPEDKPIQMSFVQVQDKVQEQLQTILTEKPEENESKPFKLAKIFYKVCMNETALNQNGKRNEIFLSKIVEQNSPKFHLFIGIKPMVEILEKYGGWPVVKGNDWDSENWFWLEIIKKISHDGLRDALILTFHIVVDSKNSTRRILAVSLLTIIRISHENFDFCLNQLNCCIFIVRLTNPGSECLEGFCFKELNIQMLRLTMTLWLIPPLFMAQIKVMPNENFTIR